MMTFASHDVDFASLTFHPGVIDPMFRQPYSDRALPLRPRLLGRSPLEIATVDYDLGAPRVAYVDRVDADYHVATGKSEQWNDGRTYRNDGVDIAREGDGTPYVRAFEAGEWMQYTVTAEAPGPRSGWLLVAAAARATIALTLNDSPAVTVVVSSGLRWRRIAVPLLPFACGTNRLKIAVVNGNVRLKSILIE